MFIKKAELRISDFQALNVPKLRDFMVDQNITVDPSVFADTIALITKQASTVEADAIKDGDDTVFDLEAEIQSHPDSLFVKCFAIKADEPNDNGDFFSVDELMKSYATFVGVPVFTNHNNTDAEAARGKVVHSWWDDARNGIMIIARVDAEAYPQLARGIKEDYIVGTSMGCQVQYSLCSICHNRAETPDQYCSHIRERKTRKISAKEQCAFHENSDEEACPICGCTKGEKKALIHKDAEVFEYNYGIKFIENSFVVNPACHECGVTEIIDPQKFRAKVAMIAAKLPPLLKAAAQTPVMCTDQKCIKLAGQKEIEQLQSALDALTDVSQSMLTQKDQIDLEFLSDLVTVLADLQSVTDELTQQGYGRLPSPGEAGQTEMGEEGAPPSPTTPVNPTPEGTSRVQSGPAGEIGTVTSPSATLSKITLEKLARPLIPVREKKPESPNETPKRLKVPFRMG
jgi:hypothetical protein